MLVAIGLRFPAGRYHATPWGRHVNEGSVEWPPSPWRLLRSLVAVWKLKMTESEGEVMPTVLLKLLSPPDYYLPPATVGHTRHYMPLFHGKRTLVFDTFAAVEPGSEAVAVWRDAELNEAESSALRTALERLGYLGRSESWCEARLLSEEEVWQVRPNCLHSARSWAEAGLEPVKSLAAEGTVSVEPQRGAWEWLLCAETSELRRARWSDPPGSKWVTYMRRKDCFAATPKKPRLRPPPSMTVARYSLEGAVLPLVTETLSLGELARKFIQGIYGARNQGASSGSLSGKGENGEPLKGHTHAFYLPTDEDGDGRLDHLTVFAACGFPQAELEALGEFSRVRQVGGKPDVNLLLTGLGNVDDFRGLTLFGPTRVWRSSTPFVPVRHPKLRRGVILESPGEQVALELERRGYPKPVEIRPLERAQFSDRRSARWIEFRRERLTGGGNRGPVLGYGFEIRFAQEVTGPLALGYGCHFGLGQFKAVHS